jgi:hypothetical protein
MVVVVDLVTHHVRTMNLLVSVLALNIFYYHTFMPMLVKYFVCPVTSVLQNVKRIAFVYSI